MSNFFAEPRRHEMIVLKAIDLELKHKLNKDHVQLHGLTVCSEIIEDYIETRVKFFLMGQTERQLVDENKIMIPVSWWDHTLERFPILQFFGGAPRYKEIVTSETWVTHKLYPNVPGVMDPRKKIVLGEHWLASAYPPPPPKS